MTRAIIRFCVLSFFVLFIEANICDAQYNPMLGRFHQRDPIATGLPLNNATWFHGRPPQINPDVFDARQHYQDGQNLYQYVRSNPVNHTDPLGLDIFEDYDSASIGIIYDHYSSKVLLEEVSRNVVYGIRLGSMYARAAFEWDQLVWDRDEAILTDLALGGFFASTCFEEGIPVLLADGGYVPIERIEVGSRVMSWPADPNATQIDAVIDPDFWRTVRLEINDALRGGVCITLLRSLAWIELACAGTERSVWLSIPEMGIYGWARVCSVEPCPPEVAGPIAGLVTGTFQSEKAKTISVYIDSLIEPIGATDSHPFYSLDRNAWVGAGTLRTGERVRTINSETTINHIEVRAMPETVYNLEVQQTHTYFVSKAGVWVHNGCELSKGAQARFDNAKKAGDLGRTSFPALRRGDEVRIGQSHYEILEKFPETNILWESGWCRWIGGRFVFAPGSYRPF